MGLIICRRCGHPYNGRIWDECPTCARHNFMPMYNEIFPFTMRIHQMERSQDPTIMQESYPFYKPNIYVRITRRDRTR